MNTLVLWLLAVVAGGLLVVSGTAYVYKQGRDAERRVQLQHQLEVLRDRNLTDEKIRKMDQPALCVSIGGVWNDAEGLCG